MVVRGKADDTSKVIALNDFRAALQKRQSDLNAAAGSFGPPSLEYMRVNHKFEDTKAELKRTSIRLGGRAPQIVFRSLFLFWIAFILILVAEAAINKVLFDMALLSSTAVSLAASALLSCALVFLSHISGLSWRQAWSEFKERILWANVFIGFVCGGVVLACVSVIMAVRAEFALNADVGIGFDFLRNITSKILANGIIDFLRSGFATTESLIMGALNSAALLVAFIVAFLSHDSDHEYDSRVREHEGAAAELRRIQRKYGTLVRRIHAKYATQIDNARDAFCSHGGSVEELPSDNLKEQLAIAEARVGGASDEVPSHVSPSASEVDGEVGEKGVLPIRRGRFSNWNPTNPKK
jgi:hypothetical protein